MQGALPYSLPAFKFNIVCVCYPFLAIANTNADETVSESILHTSPTQSLKHQMLQCYGG